MEKEVVNYCPVCNEKLTVTNLKCYSCDLKLSGEFSLNKFSYLSKDEQAFLEAFLAAEGSYKAVQEKFGITYMRAKQRMDEILQSLGLKKQDDWEGAESTLKTAVENIPIDTNDHFLVQLIKSKLNACGGTATIPLISDGKEATIAFNPDGSGLVCGKVPTKQLTWDVFVACYNILIMNDGELYKGYARAGKLGSERLPIDSLEGYIAYAVHGIREGESAFSPGFVIAAILDWVGLLKNNRGSTLKMVTDFAVIESYEESLINAETFINALSSSEIIRKKLNQFRHWYYFEEEDIFAPSKFIGYKSMDCATYEAFTVGNKYELDGRITCRALDRFFVEISDNERSSLFQKLIKFLSKYDAEPNARCFIHVRK